MSYSERIYKELISEDASIWFIENDFGLRVILKAPTNVLKSIIGGCKVQILIGKDITTPIPVIHTGIRIFDDSINFISITGTNRFYEENESLRKILLNGSCLIDLHNELSICVASSGLIVNNSLKEAALKMIGDTRCLYTGEFSSEIITSLDAFDFSLDNSRQFENPYLIEKVALDCTFLNWNIVTTHFIGLNEQPQTALNDTNEGSSFEKLIWFSLENLFDSNIYKNPKFKSSKGDKELTDVLAFYDKGIFLIETKSLSIYSVSQSKNMDKKIGTQKKHIKKAIRQLIGANTNLNTGTDVYSSSNEVINFNRDIISHCIVLVSELLPYGDWKEIENEIINTMANERFYLNVMDFTEFMRIIKFSHGEKEYFDFYLISRVEGFVKKKNIHMKVRIIDKN